MAKKYWIIDAGHGGLKNGVYTTAPAKMFTFSDGHVIYEGVVNRKIAAELVRLLHEACIDFGLVYDEVEDTPLSTRSSLINKLFLKHPNAVSLSIHSNASSNTTQGDGGKGRGLEIFTSVGETPADAMGEVLYHCYRKYLTEFPFRADKVDGDHDKEARLHMVGMSGQNGWIGPKCPSILVENLFFDNREEAEFLNSGEGQKRIAVCLFEWIKLIEKI